MLKKNFKYNIKKYTVYLHTNLINNYNNREMLYLKNF